jgi:protein ImuB
MVYQSSTETKTALLRLLETRMGVWLCAASSIRRYRLARAWVGGPQRLEAGWLENEEPALRDYFVARSQRHGLFWIYCDRLGGKEGTGGKDAAQWYLHGVFA